MLTAARGMGIENDVAQYLAGMIPVTRGKTASLSEMKYGDEENGIKPAKEFINECDKYPGLLDTAMAVEGIVSGRSIHASGVIIFDSPYIDHNVMMRAPNGQAITQWDMDDSSYTGGLKFDFLTINNLDSIHICMDLLIENGFIKWQGSLRKTYNKYLHPDVLDYTSEEMWEMAERLEIVNLFQFQTQVGAKAIQAIKPRSLSELETANAAMRLMVKGQDKEQPIDTFVRYKNDINEWYRCMREDYKLNEDEISILEKYLKNVYGVATMQEEVMQLSMDEHIAGFSMLDANYLRRSIAKKKVKLQIEAHDKFYKHGQEIGTRINMLDYVWNETIAKMLGYSFSLPHLAAYSTIAVQEMNLAYHYPIIYWNTACLIVNAGADDDSEENKSTQYGKIAAAIANMQKRGINISLPLINSAKFGFVPDEANNRIIYALKAMNNIGDDLAHAIVENQPYASFEDFCERMVDTKIVQKSKMVTLIKAGCFTELDNPDRTVTMRKFIQRIVKPLEKLTMVQLPMLVEHGIVPEDLRILVRVKNFKDYVTHESFFVRNVIDKDKKKIPKKGYHDRIFVLDEVSMEFFNEHFSQNSVVGIQDEFYLISEKKFLKEWEEKIQPLKEWFPTALEEYNNKLVEKEYENLASGSIAKWEMDALNYYYTEHELAHLDNEKYGIVDFFNLPEDPEPYEYYVRYIQGEKKYIPKNKIVRLAGTVLDNDNNRHMITLLTTTGVVGVKFSKGQYVYYNRQIKVPIEGSDKSKIAEYSWFKRGNKLIICGYRSGDTFRAYRYKDTIYQHCAMKIEEVRDDGSVYLISGRGEEDN